MKLLIVLPILIPFATAIASLFVRRWILAQRILGVAGAAGLLGAALALLKMVEGDGIQAVQIGNWPAPYGITLVADLFGAIMVTLAGLMGFAVAVYSLASMDAQREKFGYYSLLHIMLMGVCGAFLTGDLFNLYVWFEVLLISSFVLMALGGERAQIEGALKYVTLNLISSALFLAGIGILYGKIGTLNMADLAYKLSLEPQSNLINSSAMLFLIAFGIKAAIFPLFFWLPDSYHTPPVAVSAIFAGLLTKVGVYVMIRAFTLFFVQDVGFTHTLILVLAGLTMVTGVLGAVAQNEMRRLLSFHIISQIGYILMGLGLFRVLALAGAIFFILHVSIVKVALFLVSGVVERLRGTGQLKELGGLYRAYPCLAVLFIIPAMSLAGIPPLSGFFAKLALVKAGLEMEQYAIVITALGVSLLTLFSMIKIWGEVFWKPEPTKSEYIGSEQPQILKKSQILFLSPIVLLAFLAVLFGLAAEPFFTLATRAAEQLLDPSEYIHAVFGGKP
ncbi:MAG: Na+/H+ antiporter subunit D [Candidatus Scalindua rubra]|nr:Na+/H+ antiporter subunit D [Candidatus Scalindua rubra]TWU31913.1 Na(+)/H(+) antiporter subunit D [Candidatus Brocadiaceae bacterium S225]